MKKILVTGGTGYIGSHTVVELINEGYEPIIIDNLSNSSKAILGQIQLITGFLPDFHEIDLADEKQLAGFLDQNPGIEGVIHFAAFKAVGESVNQPLKYYKNNFYSLINLLCAFGSNPLKFIFSSSCTVYGQPEILPVRESSPVKKAESPYGNTKQIAEEILQETSTALESLQVLALRYFNPAGAHDSALIGELPMGVPQNLIPFVTQCAAGKRDKITVFGNDYNTPDGTCIRDYIHVVDLAKAHVAALKYIERTPELRFDVLNIGTGTGNSVLEIIETFKKVTGVQLDYKIGARRAGDIEQIWGAVDKADELLEWKAEHKIDKILSSAWAWEEYLTNSHLFNPIPN